jgi:hypothetical protein
MTKSPLFRRARPCEKHLTADIKEADAVLAESNVIAIDCWEEFLDHPKSFTVFRARGNWQARLAAAAASVQKGLHTKVLPNDVCITCIGLCVGLSEESFVA